jgi:DNA-binding NtrC family response regulator
VEDIPLLVKHFLHSYRQIHHTQASELAPDALDALVTYRWPGNVRELKNVVERIVLKAPGRVVERSDLPPDILRALVASGADGGRSVVDQNTRPSHAQELASLMFDHGQSFWSAVYPLFIARDLTRSDLRKLVQVGLERTNGNYRLLVQLFNMAPEDYKRFLSFLRKHDCHLPFQRFRAVPARLQQPPKAKAEA